MEARPGKASEIGVRAQDWWGLGKVFWWGGACRRDGVDDWGKQAWKVGHGVSFEATQMKPNHNSKLTTIPTSNPLWIPATVEKHLNKQSNPLWIPPLCSYRSS